MPNQHVLILGSGAAGVAAARALASREDVRVTLVARTGETPYIRMHIKGVAFGPTPPEMITLPLPDVEIISDTAVEVDTSAKEVQFASGARLSYDALIVATGSRPRMLPTEVGGGDAVTDAERVGSLHSLEDALRVRKLLTNLGRAARVAIYGGGVIAADFPRERFTRNLYLGLSTHGYFGFIAHYDIHGFYAEQMSTPERRTQFLRELAVGCGREAHLDRPDLWSDVKAVLAQHLPPDQELGPPRRLAPLSAFGSRSSTPRQDAPTLF